MIALEKVNNLRSDKIGFFRFKKFDNDSFLITNDIGKYAFLDKEEFGNFISGKLDKGIKFEELLDKKFIKFGEYENEMINDYAIKNSFLNYGPVLHIIVTTLRCNHKCQYCHAAAASIKDNTMDMTEETAKNAVDAIFYTSSPNLTIEFQGGEPLLNWDILKYIVEYSEIKASHLAKNVTFALVSNLSLMDDEKLDYLLKHKVQISTSLDGDEEVHNYNRIYKSGNSFLEVTNWIKKINSKYEELGILDSDGKPVKVGALLTVTKKALPKYKEIIDTYVGLGLNGIFIRPLNPYGFASVDLEKLSYSTVDFVDFYKKSLEYIIELNRKGIKFLEILTTIYLHKIFRENDPNYLDQRNPCGAGIGQVAYNFDGKIYSCDEGRMLGRMGDDSFMLGNLDEDGKKSYNNFIDNETTKILVQASTLDGLPGYNEDVYKPYLGVCPINSYKLSGNLIPNYKKDSRRDLDSQVLDNIFLNLKNDNNKKILESWVGVF